MTRPWLPLLVVVLALGLLAPPAWAKRVKKKKGKKNKDAGTEQVEDPAETAGRAEERAAAAEQAYDAGDFETAFVAAQEALAIDPGNARALRIRGRVLLEVGIISMRQGDPAASEMVTQGLQDLQLSIDLAPDAPESAEVRKMLLALAGTSLFPDPHVECPEEAVAAHDEAEAHFANGEMDGAAEAYERALAGCPGHAVWWMYYGDVDFVREDSEGALDKFRKSLELEPFFWRAHRFASDTHHRLGDLPNTYRSAMLSVACNPTYANGWDYLGQTMDNYGGTLRYVTVDWPGPVANEGGPVIAVTPPEDDSDEASFESALMLIYNMGRVPIDEETQGMSPLELERRAVEIGLSFLAERGVTGEFERPMLQAWQLLARASADGMLDEAIFMLRLDESLLPEFIAFREAHLDRLIVYTATHLAVLEPDSPISANPDTFRTVLPELDASPPEAP